MKTIKTIILLAFLLIGMLHVNAQIGNGPEPPIGVNPDSDKDIIPPDPGANPLVKTGQAAGEIFVRDNAIIDMQDIKDFFCGIFPCKGDGGGGGTQNPPPADTTSTSGGNGGGGNGGGTATPEDDDDDDKDDNEEKMTAANSSLMSFANSKDGYKTIAYTLENNQKSKLIKTMNASAKNSLWDVSGQYYVKFKTFMPKEKKRYVLYITDLRPNARKPVPCAQYYIKIRDNKVSLIPSKARKGKIKSNRNGNRRKVNRNGKASKRGKTNQRR